MLALVSIPRVAHEHVSPEVEAVTQMGQIGLDDGGTGGVAREGLQGHQAAVVLGQQAEGGPRPVGAVVVAVAVGRQPGSVRFACGGSPSRGCAPISR